MAGGTRVHLRRPCASDRREVLAIARKSRKLHRPWVLAPSSVEAFEAWLQGAHSAQRERLLLCQNDNGAIAGYFSLGEIVPEPLKSAYLGYWVNAALAGQGLMQEGLGLVLRYAFQELRLHRVEANIQPDNLASIALVRRCGLRREGFSPRYLKVSGRWRDHERWALTVEDWREQRAPSR